MRVLFVTALFAASVASAADLAPSSFSVSTGTSSGSAASLAKADGKVVNLYTNRKGNLAAVFEFANVSSSASVSARFLQKRAADAFTFQYQSASGAFVDLGVTSGSASSYKSLNYALPAAAVVNGHVSIRIVSSSGADDSKLDSLLLSASVAAPSVPSAPAPTPAATPAPVPPSSSSSALPAGTSWYWQLQGSLNLAVNVKVYDIDLYDTSVNTIAALKQAGHTVICYFSAGTYEDWRSDASQFPAASLGSNNGWPGEKWIDIRNATVRQIIANRMDLAKSKGCDGLEPDNVDGYANKSGFPLTAQDQIGFNTFLADQAHARGMTVALKNATDLVSTLVDKFDFAVVEECFKYNECSAYSPFIQKNKAVLNAEYTSYSAATCSKAASLKFSTVFYNLDLNGKVFNPCP